MTKLFLGIDIGSTKSHALLADAEGQVRGFGQGGGANPDVVGHEVFADVLQAIITEALAQAGARVEQIAGAGLGIGGYDWPSQAARFRQGVDRLGLQAPVEIVNDALIALYAGSPRGWGVAVIAGTSCNCRGRTPDGREGRIAGFGLYMGEAAGAAELAWRALQAVSRDWSRRGPATALTPAFVAQAGARDAGDLIEGLTTGRYRLGAETAPLIFDLAAQGDPVAAGLLAWAVDELTNLAEGVIRQLALEDRQFDLVLGGSLFAAHPELAQQVGAGVQRLAPGAQPLRLQAPPVVGGVVLGLKLASLESEVARRQLVRALETRGDEG